MHKYPLCKHKHYNTPVSISRNGLCGTSPQNTQDIRRSSQEDNTDPNIPSQPSQQLGKICALDHHKQTWSFHLCWHVQHVPEKCPNPKTFVTEVLVKSHPPHWSFSEISSTSTFCQKKTQLIHLNYSESITSSRPCRLSLLNSGQEMKLTFHSTCLCFSN